MVRMAARGYLYRYAPQAPTQLQRPRGLQALQALEG
jgi:hypothetical protein